MSKKSAVWGHETSSNVQAFCKNSAEKNIRGALGKKKKQNQCSKFAHCLSIDFFFVRAPWMLFLAETLQKVQTLDEACCLPLLVCVINYWRHVDVEIRLSGFEGVMHCTHRSQHHNEAFHEVQHPLARAAAETKTQNESKL